MAELYYYDILSKLVTHMEGIKDDDLCCHRLDYHTYEETMNFLINSGYVIEVLIDNKKGYKSTYEGNMHILDICKKRRAREDAKKDPNSILEIIDKIDTCWISMERLKPEDATEIKMTNLHDNFQFVTVIVRDDNGHVGVANRIKQTPTGNQYLDAAITTTDWHWSKGDFEPTHWMPFPRRVNANE